MTHANLGKTIATTDNSPAPRLGQYIRHGMLLTFLAAAAGCSGSTTSAPAVDQGVGGSTSAAATGGASYSNTGGVVNTGGMVSTGGANSQGGAMATGGAKAGGGTAATGGTKAGGGVAATGGSVAAGGLAATGGSVAAGGLAATGGSVAAGGKAGTSTGGKAATGGTAALATTTPPAGGAATGGATGASTGGEAGTFGLVENSGSNCNATSASLLSSELKTLPDPFAMHSGTRISAKADWECRRNEILADVQKYEVGPKPDPSETTVTATYSGGNLSVAVKSTSGSLTIKSAVSGSGSCVIIGTDMATSVTGCTTLLFSTADVISYNNDSGSQNQGDPFYKVFPSLWGKIGNYTAWAWGVSRMIDGLDQVKDQLKIDMTKIATHGCSYAGKMSLFAAAMDERVALGIVQESGGGGIDAWRASADFTSRTGTSVEKIDNTNYAWFMSSMKSLDPYKLPHDHHELIAAIAPRAVIALGNPGYQWLGDESGYKSITAAAEVFKALGVADSIGYDFTGNHAHCSAPTSQVNSINAFVNKFLKGQTSANTNIAIKPSDSSFQLTADYSWTAPTLN